MTYLFAWTDVSASIEIPPQGDIAPYTHPALQSTPMNEQDAALKVRDSIQAVFLELMLDEDAEPTEDDFVDSEVITDVFLDLLGFKVVGVTDTTITCEITNQVDLPQ